MRRALLCAFLAAAVPAAAPAAETPAEPAGWSGEAELGAVFTGGNTETENVNAKAAVAHDGARWRHAAKAEAVLASDDQGTTGERYLANVKSDLKLGEANYLFVTANWEKDRFSGYDYRVSEAVGYGRRLVAGPPVTVDVEVGPGARQSRQEDVGGVKTEYMARLAGKLEWGISETSTLTEDLSSEIGEDATVTRSVTALKTQVAGQLATKISFTVKHTSDVPPGVEETDYETAVTLVYGF
jgi:putative salt-induced outer membrane protein